ncbi:MAG: YqaE/Pmp3 family membrane protein, partial [Salibacteraceae bacterium]|nr:YqaE/Pmp3 family membrane protein [Salibacteraceae bacterium]
SLSKKLNTEVENPISESTLSDYKGIEQDVNSETLPVSIDSDEMLVLMLILSIIPPLAVFLLFGFKLEFWLSLLLTIILWLPGFIYAVYLVLKEAGKI